VSDFIHLTNKTEYSLSEGALPIARISELCQAFKMPAVGITDTNNMFGALEFSEKVSSVGVQPIIGCNLKIKTPKNYLHENIENEDLHFFLNVFSKNEVGYKNLLNIISSAYMNHKENAYVDIEQLYKNKEGLLVLSGGNNSILKYSNGNNITSQSVSFIADFKKEFIDNFYIEIQRIEGNDYRIDEEVTLNLAYDNNIPVVATNDVYFEGPDHFEAHDALMCIEKKLFVSQKDRKRLSKNHYFKSQNEMQELFSDIPEALSNTIEIAQRCSHRPKIKMPVLPSYHNDDSQEKKLLRELSYKGLEQNLSQKFASEQTDHNSQLNVKKEYEDRLEKELKIIIDMKYEGYFLIVSDFIRWAKDNDIPVGPGRGSGAGSLVAWCLKITNLDPIKFGLIFERFLNPERVSLPDFDIDFCRDGRDRVLDYVHSKYGNNHVAQIITFGKLQARAVIRDVGRVLGIPYGQVDYLCKLMPFDPSRPMTLQQYIDEEPRLYEEANKDDKVANLLDISLKLEGLKRHASIHAAGVVISKEEVFKDVPIYSDPDSDILLTQFDMKWVENAGLVKFDFLGLKTLTLIDNCVRLVKTNNPSFNIDDININDQKTYDLLSTGETTGIFQLESAGMKDTLKQLKPDKFEDIIAIVALYRPGPMANIPSYIERKHGREKPDYIHPLLEKLLEETYGVIIYQEQVMGVARELSGYSDGEADLLRRAMGKKIQKEMNAQKQRFIDGCLKKDIKANEAHSIFDLLSKFADYGFNKSHAAAYAMIAFQTAYLKTHYPIEFFAASMTLDMNNTDKISIFQQELTRLKIKLSPPSINYSGPNFLRNNNTILYALGAIKNVGIESMKDLYNERNMNGSFRDLNDFINRCSNSVINKKTIEALSCAGAFDEFKINRAAIFNQASDIVKHHKSLNAKTYDSQEDMFSETALSNFNLNNDEEWKQSYKLMKEYEMLGFYLSGHPLEMHKNNYKTLLLKEYNEIKENSDLHNKKDILIGGTLLSKKEKRSAKGSAYAFLNFSDLSSIYELIIFESNLRKYREFLIEGESFVLGVDFTTQNGTLRGELKKVFSFKEVENLNNNENRRVKTKENIKRHTLKIYADGNFSKNELAKLKWAKGDNKIEIIYNNQLLKIPGQFNITSEMITKMKSFNGVKKIDLVE
jgi:DNA polymerase-3 subunit alpha